MPIDTTPNDKYRIMEFKSLEVTRHWEHRLRTELFCKYHVPERECGWEAIRFQVVLNNSKEFPDLRKLSFIEIEARAMYELEQAIDRLPRPFKRIEYRG
jgi:hypothetical protein